VTRVLYVEDNDDNVNMLKMRLELLDGFEVLVAEDGEVGCSKAIAEKPDVILMDLDLPVVDGWEIAPAQEQPGDARHPDHRADRPCHVGLAREGACRGLRRLRHQAGGFRPAHAQDQSIAGKKPRDLMIKMELDDTLIALA
jgi:CheY-like chemotaxis protein